MKNHEAKVEQLFNYMEKNDSREASPEFRRENLRQCVMNFNEINCAIDEDFSPDEMTFEYLTLHP